MSEIPPAIRSLDEALSSMVYETFDFYDIPSAVVREELLKLRRIKATKKER
jgi:hypothetical protein